MGQRQIGLPGVAAKAEQEPKRVRSTPKHRRSLNLRALHRERQYQTAFVQIISSDIDPRIQRPRQRFECAEMPRPCPYVGCRHNAFLEVNSESGTIHFNFPGKQVWECADLCTLDLAEDGPRTFEQIGPLLGMTGARAQQIDVQASIKYQANMDAMKEEGGD